MAGFYESASGIRAPKPAAVGAKSSIVFGRYLKYSRFRETGAGDRVRSALRGRVCSVTGQILRIATSVYHDLNPRTGEEYEMRDYMFQQRDGTGVWCADRRPGRGRIALDHGRSERQHDACGRADESANAALKRVAGDAGC
jgi:hypothetical protein